MLALFTALLGYAVGIKHADAQHSAITGERYNRRLLIGPIIEVIEQGTENVK